MLCRALSNKLLKQDKELLISGQDHVCQFQPILSKPIIIIAINTAKRKMSYVCLELGSLQNTFLLIISGFPILHGVGCQVNRGLAEENREAKNNQAINKHRFILWSMEYITLEVSSPSLVWQLHKAISNQGTSSHLCHPQLLASSLTVQNGCWSSSHIPRPNI